MQKISLQKQLLGWLVFPLGLLLIANSLLSLNQATVTASIVTDRLLLSSARNMAQSIHMVNDLLEVEISPSAIEMLASGERDMSYYQIRGPLGGLLAGTAELPTMKLELGIDEAFFSDSVFRGHPFRIVRLNQPVPGSPTPGYATITVGQTLYAREKMAHELWIKGLIQQTLLVVAAAGLVWLGLKRGLEPLNKLQKAVNRRPVGSLAPLTSQSAPYEVQPLISAFNDYVARLNALSETQRRFVANAAHQFRTPLALLKAQVAFGLRETEKPGKDEALSGISSSLDHLTRLTNQLLVLARVEHHASFNDHVEVDLVPIIHSLSVDFTTIALDRSIDFGLEISHQNIMVRGNPTLLRELMANLIDNALCYTPQKGIVTARLVLQNQIAVFTVQDTGPGIPEAVHQRVFERFYRLPGTSLEGSGLGLAIVQEIAISHSASIKLSAPTLGTGLVVEVTFQGA